MFVTHEVLLLHLLRRCFVLLLLHLLRVRFVLLLVRHLRLVFSIGQSVSPAGQPIN